MIASESRFGRDVPRWDPTDAIDNLIANSRGAFTLIAPFLGPSTRVLEIGSGNGLGLCDLLLRGVAAVGVEPGRTISFEGRHNRAVAMLEANGFMPASQYLVDAVGENLPFEDQSFDVVFSIAVLEHVADVQQVLREAIRVTRRGGVVIMNVPNHWSFWEAHYRVAWAPPLLWLRPLARWYVRARGRADYYVDELRTVTPWRVGAILRRIPNVRYELRPYAFGQAAKISSLAWYERSRRHPVAERLVRIPGLTAAARVFSWGAAVLGLSAVFDVVVRVDP